MVATVTDSSWSEGLTDIDGFSFPLLQLHHVIISRIGIMKDHLAESFDKLGING